MQLHQYQSGRIIWMISGATYSLGECLSATTPSIYLQADHFNPSPNILALNFASTHTQSLLLLIILMGISAILLFHFRRATLHCQRYNTTEGLQQPEPRGAKWGLVIVSFFLTVIYLPLSTLAVHVLVWSQDLWVVPNPYVNATTNPPVVSPLGPPDAFRDPLDFCWTTTMAKSQVNFAPVVIIISAFAFITVSTPSSIAEMCSLFP